MCWACDLWLSLDDFDMPPAFCPACGESTTEPDDEHDEGRGCGDDECSLHSHCLIVEPRYRPDECDYCRGVS